jgi:prepilin signal peptidase PulO-like enzyme (type II secretory pathway)
MGIFFLIYFLRGKQFEFSFKNLNWKRASTVAICLFLILGSVLIYIYLMREKVLELVVRVDPSRVSIWKHTIQMVEDFPLWGVGIGEFNFALAKYSPGYTWGTIETFHPHNYFLQIAAEMGLIGLYAFLWILGIIFIKGLHIMRGKRDFVKLGIWFGIIGFIFTFFGDCYLWNIEMELMFFLCIGLLFVDEEKNEMAQTHRRSFERKLLIGLSIILFLTIPLQIYQRFQISFLSERSLGLYQEKFKDEGGEYQWGEKVVMIPLEVKGNWIHIPIRFGNPDIKEHPVKAKIFVNRRIIDPLDFKDNDWHMLRYPIQNMESPEILLKIEASRTWNPYLMGVKHEIRDLGPALGKIFWSS